MGSSCVITARVVVPVACTTLPGSTSRKPTCPRDRRHDVAIVQLQLVIGHRALVVLDRALGLLDQLLLVRHRLFGDGVARQGGAIPGEIQPGLGQNTLVMLQRSLRLLQGGPVRSRVDINERITFLDPLILLVVHRLDHAVDLTGDRTGVHRRHRADGLQIDPDITLDGHGGRHCHPGDIARRSSRCRGLMMAPPQPQDNDERNHDDQQDDTAQLHGGIIRRGKGLLRLHRWECRCFSASLTVFHLRQPTPGGRSLAPARREFTRCIPSGRCLPRGDSRERTRLPRLVSTTETKYCCAAKQNRRRDRHAGN